MNIRKEKITYLLVSLAVFLLTVPAQAPAAQETKTLEITKNDLGGPGEFLLSFTLGGARVTVTPSADENIIVRAVVTYDSSIAEPSLSTSAQADTYSAEFSSGFTVDRDYDGYPLQEWDITVGAFDVDTDLTIAGGGVGGDIELGGLPLRSCSLTMGGVDTDIYFSTPTTRQVEELFILGGGMNIGVYEIGNTDFQDFRMIGGGFIASLDFEGAYESAQHDVRIIGAGNRLRITVPSDAGEKLDVLAVGALVDVTGSGWERDRYLFFFQDFVTSDYSSQPVKLDFDMTVAGSLLTVDRN